ncbi:MAG: ABC transporter permease [Planctomycetota bacterium]
MRGLGTIFRKEMRAYFVSPIPYVVMALFSALAAWIFFFERRFWFQNSASLDGTFFFNLERLLVVLVPLIGMRAWSEERRGGTIETLMTEPVTTTSVVLGKFFAAWAVLGLCLLSTLGLVITVASLGDLDPGPVIGGYLGAFLLSGALLAVATWISSFTSHQLVAFIVAFLIGAVFIFMQSIADDVKGGLGRVLESASLTSHFQAMGRGVVDLRDVVYFASAIFFFLYLNVRSIENRRYR